LIASSAKLEKDEREKKTDKKKVKPKKKSKKPKWVKPKSPKFTFCACPNKNLDKPLSG